MIVMLPCCSGAWQHHPAALIHVTVPSLHMIALHATALPLPAELPQRTKLLQLQLLLSLLLETVPAAQVPQQHVH